MKDRLERLARGMLEPINIHATSILGALTFVWGLWILVPFWDVFDNATIYSRMDDFAPEWAWGSWATLCGLMMLFCLIREHFRGLRFAYGFAVWHWWTVSNLIWWSDWQNTGGVTYTFIAIYTTFIYLNIKVNDKVK